MRFEKEIEPDWNEWRRDHPPRKAEFDDGDAKKVVSEVFIVEDAGSMGDYVKLVQRMKDQEGSPWIRFTYYRKRALNEPWRFAGQTSLLASLEDARELLRRADREGLFSD